MQDRPHTPSRRSFFAGAAAAGAAATAVVALPRAVGEPAATPSLPAREMPERGGGYHLSEHVKHYYKTTQI